MLRADVPVGCYLSGGLDSSLIAALGRRVKGEKFLTFSIRFEDAEYDETPLPALGGGPHRQRPPGGRRAAPGHRRRLPGRGRPRGAAAPADRPRAPVPAVEAGPRVRDQGGPHRGGRRRDVRRLRPVPGGEDPPLLGARSRLDDAPAPARAALPVPLPLPGLAASRWRGTSSGGAGTAGAPRASPTRRGGRGPRRSSASSRPGFARRRGRVDVVGAAAGGRCPPTSGAGRSWRRTSTWRSGRSCPATCSSSQGDRMLMAHSVEGRFPFLDPDVVALANSLPPSYKLRVLDEKHVLKRAAAGPGAGRGPPAPQAALPRARRPVLRRAGGAGVGGRADRRVPWWRTRACSSPAPSRGSGGSARPPGAAPSSRTPTTWRWWACSRRASSTSSSCGRRRPAQVGLRLQTFVDRLPAERSREPIPGRGQR